MGQDERLIPGCSLPLIYLPGPLQQAETGSQGDLYSEHLPLHLLRYRAKLWLPAQRPNHPPLPPLTLHPPALKVALLPPVLTPRHTPCPAMSPPTQATPRSPPLSFNIRLCRLHHQPFCLGIQVWRARPVSGLHWCRLRQASPPPPPPPLPRRHHRPPTCLRCHLSWRKATGRPTLPLFLPRIRLGANGKPQREGQTRPAIREATPGNP